LRATTRACLLSLALPVPAQAQSRAADVIDAPTANSRNAGIVSVTANRLGSLPTQIPTTIEGISGAEIDATINATDSADALKYFPSLLVRKRYIGDYDHAVLSTRASGTGNSARSRVVADGILLSNLLGNGASFTPRWGLVTPEEIERVDVLYGPFSAAYPSNSVGALSPTPRWRAFRSATTPTAPMAGLAAARPAPASAAARATSPGGST
jgi:iron complex outermembrane receptor protein